MPNLKQLNWGRIAIAFILFLVIGSIIFAVVRSATYTAPENKPVTVQSVKDSIEDKANDTKKAPAPAPSPPSPKPAPAPTPPKPAAPSAQTPPPPASPAPASPNLARTGPATNIALLFVSATIIGSFVHNRYLRRSVTIRSPK